MDGLGISADTRKSVRFVDDEECAYVVQRYRETHDFVHCLLGLGVSEEEEMVIKWFEAVQTGLPMCYLGGTVGPLRLAPALRSKVYRQYIPWARRAAAAAPPMINVYWEERFHCSLDALREELRIELPPPELRENAIQPVFDPPQELA
jgi:ubiquinone biosynthesis protein COQ4